MVNLSLDDLFTYNYSSAKFNTSVKDKDYFEINLVYTRNPFSDLNVLSMHNRTYTFYANYEFIEPNVHILKDSTTDTNGAGSTATNPIYNPDSLQFDANRVQDSSATATGTSTDRETYNKWIIKNADGTPVTKDLLGRPIVTEGFFAEGQDVFNFVDIKLLPDGLYTAEVVETSLSRFGTKMEETEKTYFAVAGPFSNIDGETTGSQNHVMPKTDDEYEALYEVDIKNVTIGGKYGKPNPNSILVTEVTYNIYTRNGVLVKSGSLGDNSTATDFAKVLEGVPSGEDYIIEVIDTLYLRGTGSLVKTSTTHSTYARFHYQGIRFNDEKTPAPGSNVADVSPNLLAKYETPVNNIGTEAEPESTPTTPINVNDNPSTGR